MTPRVSHNNTDPSKPPTTAKYQWTKCDILQYNTSIRQDIDNIIVAEGASIDATLQTLTELLHCAAKASTPVIKQQKRKSCMVWSEEINNKLKKSKSALHEWQDAGRPPKPHALQQAKYRASKALRSSIRRETAQRRENLIEEINSASSFDQKLFFKLINSHKHTGPTTEIYYDNQIASSTEELLDVWSNHFATLAKPSTNSNFDPSFKEVAADVVLLAETLYQAEDSRHEFHPITLGETLAALKKLNLSKSPDAFGLTAEHLKLAPPQLMLKITDIFNVVLQRGRIPDALRMGFIVPVPKSGRDPHYVDSYRGITITPVLSKLLEHTLLARIHLDQAQMQFGFTKGKTPLLAALAVTEHIAESKDSKQPLYLTALDVRKAFDVVDHEILKFRLLTCIKDPYVWSVVSDMLTGAEAKVRINGSFGPNFAVQQGVGQGRILSTLEYKIYLNPLLHSLENLGAGCELGHSQAGHPTCADDIILAANNSSAQQLQLSVVSNFAKTSRYEIHPGKSKTILHRAPDGNTLAMDDCLIPEVQSLTHLGIDRYSDSMCPDQLIDDKIKSARKAAYALMGPGFHGINGMNPNTARALLQAYVIPRLLYGIEAVVLTQRQITKLEQYFKTLLKHLQSMADNTADPAVYILIGLLPIEATYDKHLVSLMAAALKDHFFNKLALSQFARKSPNSSSWFIYCQKRLSKYKHTTPAECLISNIDPTSWATKTKKAIDAHWTQALADQAAAYSSLRYLKPQSNLSHKSHPVWSTSLRDARSTRAAIINAKLLTGTYRLQANRAAFNQRENNPECLLCHKGPEDRKHFLLLCQSTEDIRHAFLPRITGMAETFYTPDGDEDLIGLILDPAGAISLPTRHSQYVRAICVLTKRFIFKLHCRRQSITSARA